MPWPRSSGCGSDLGRHHLKSPRRCRSASVHSCILAWLHSESLQPASLHPSLLNRAPSGLHPCVPLAKIEECLKSTRMDSKELIGEPRKESA